MTLGGAANAQTPQKKLALIIANSDYDGDGKVDASPDGRARAQERGYIGDLQNCWFDGVRVGEALTRAGFEVQTAYNAQRGAMIGAIMNLRARADAAGPNTATVLYYAGHGVQLGGQTYLVGTGAQLIADEMATETAEDRTRLGLRIGVPVTEILMRAHSPAAPGYNLILVDACRDNPWEGQIREAAAAEGRDYVGERGFGAMTVMTPRTVVGFSSQPGQIAQDGVSAASSPFANAVSRRAGQRGLAIDQLMQGARGEVAAMSGAHQIPDIHGRLGDMTSLAP